MSSNRPGRLFFVHPRHSLILAGLLAASISLSAPTNTPPAGPTNIASVSAPQIYRNLFAETGHSPVEIKTKTAAAFARLFHGDPATEAVYFSAGTNQNGALAYIYDTVNRDVRSEGMSYGMMITVQLNQRAEFDALWNWAKTFMYQDSPTHPAAGFFSWSMTTNGAAKDEMPAPDGEQYFATSLYFAAARWGNGSGIYNYQAEADRLLSDLKNRGTIHGQTMLGQQTGQAIFDPVHKMVRFSSDVAANGRTDPSYHLPAFYELWSRWGPPADRAFWHEASLASRDFFQRAAHPVTGLCPEYANYDGSPWQAPHNRGSADFRFDAWRTAMNWAMDWSWWQADKREQALSDRLLAFFASQDMTNYVNQYTLDGRPLSTDHSPGLVAMNAVAVLASTRPADNKFVTNLWNLSVPEGQYRYYDGLLYMLGMLHCSGEFRIWPPEKLMAGRP